MRTTALFRVIVWHAFGAAAITYFVAAVPAMFFVTGSLLAQSLNRRSWHEVLRDRGRRLLLPLWVFGAVAFAAMTLADRIAPSARTRVPWRSAVFWIVPLGDPHGSAWEGGWMSSPLWYLRAMLWLLLLSPLLRRAVQRMPQVAFAVPLALVFALDWVGRHPTWIIHGAPMLLWEVGDVALYAVFLMAGFLHRDGLLQRISPPRWLAAALLFGSTALLWIITQPVPRHVVNNSHPAHLFIGAAWLSVSLAAQRPLSWVASSSVGGAVVRWINQRSLTVYLWHSTAIILTYEVISRRGPLPTGVYSTSLLAGTACLTLFFVVAFGWIEDIAARRVPRLWPLALERSDPMLRRSMEERHRRIVRGAVGAPAFVGVLLLGVVATSIGGPGTATSAAQTVTAARAKRPPVPSQAPQRSAFQPSNEAVDVVVERSSLTPPLEDSGVSLADELAPAADERFAAALNRTVQQWIATWQVPGVEVGVLKPGVVTWSGAAGVDPYSGERTTLDDAIDIDSLTKTFTAALTLQLVDRGQLELDAPLPPLDAVPSFPYSAHLTVRELLTHTSGLANYRDTAAWAANPDAIDSPERAIAAAGADPLRYAPGAGSNYSSTNYLVLGLLIEQASGATYDDLLNGEYIRPLALTHTWHAAPEPQAPNFSTGGLISTTGDLLRWATALYRERIVVSPASYELMASIDPSTWLGAGSFGYCPCTIDHNGVHHFRYIGHSGGRTVLEYSAQDDLIVVINVTDSLWVDGRGRAITELTEQLRELVAAYIPPLK